MKFDPHILIYKVELSDRSTNNVVQELYFLSYRRAKRFVQKNKAEIHQQNLYWLIGGEILWLW